MYDFMKINNPKYIHIANLALSSFRKQHSRNPALWNLEDAKKFLKLIPESYTLNKSPEELAQLHELCVKFSMTCTAMFPPLCAFMGGLTA